MRWTIVVIFASFVVASAIGSVAALSAGLVDVANRFIFAAVVLSGISVVIALKVSWRRVKIIMIGAFAILAVVLATFWRPKPVFGIALGWYPEVTIAREIEHLVPGADVTMVAFAGPDEAVSVDIGNGLTYSISASSGMVLIDVCSQNELSDLEMYTVFDSIPSRYDAMTVTVISFCTGPWGGVGNP